MTSTSDCSVVLFFGELCSIWGNKFVSNDWWEVHGATKARDPYQRQLSDGQDLSAVPPHSTMPSNFFLWTLLFDRCLAVIIFCIGHVRIFPFLPFKRHNVVFCNGEGFYALAAVEKQQQQQQQTERQKALKTFPNSFFQKLEPLLSVAVLSIKSGP